MLLLVIKTITERPLCDADLLSCTLLCLPSLIEFALRIVELWMNNEDRVSISAQLFLFRHISVLCYSFWVML
ncbi:hypothetical protein BVRB_5g104270 [Beta vulgaris subsp. vulgaris]|nr:hypothetical protein BVRB_5g104270 [Beta vulgaris subsp. vulgaris]